MSRHFLSLTAAVTAGALLLLTPSVALAGGNPPPPRPKPSGSASQPAAPSTSGGQGPGTYTVEQAISDRAQLNTIAFDGLGFLTGSIGSDSFFPPGKVADFWGFQYLRDNDPSEMGHNTDFLTKASLNMLNVLSTDQKAQLVALAKKQVTSINDYGYQRFVLMTAFRRLLTGDLPTGTTGLSQAAVKAFSADLYKLDGQISYERAAVMGPIIASLSEAQRSTLDAMVGKGMTSWPTATEPDDLRSLSHDEKVAVMTYAGDLFSWYAGSVAADVYFCPERHGTYFGSFYLKDAPAVGNAGYSIPTNTTGDMGEAFLNSLTVKQKALVTGLVPAQKSDLAGIVKVRQQVSTLLRQFRSGQTPSATAVQDLMATYGQLDGSLNYRYANAFAEVGQSLSAEQQTKLAALRKQTVGDFTPTGAFLYATPISIPTVRNTDFLFG